MQPQARYEFFRRKFRQQLGGSISRAADQHLRHAASAQQVLEMAAHEIALGRQVDAESIEAVQHQLQASLASARAAVPTKTTKTKRDDVIAICNAKSRQAFGLLELTPKEGKN